MKLKNKVFLFGSSLENLKEIKVKIANYYPNIDCKYLSPAYKDEFSEEENRKYLKLSIVLARFSFVSLTAPKQEKWVDKFKNDIEASHIASVGAVFDFYSGRIKGRLTCSGLWHRMALQVFKGAFKARYKKFICNS